MRLLVFEQGRPCPNRGEGICVDVVWPDGQQEWVSAIGSQFALTTVQPDFSNREEHEGGI